MEKSIKINLYQEEKLIFADNLENISQKISEVLPFGKVAILSFSDEFFNFGNQLKNLLLQNGLKVIDIIISNNFSAQKDVFNDFLYLPEDVRGVIAFDERLIPLIFSNFLIDKTAFYIEIEKISCGLTQNYFYVRDYDLLEKLQNRKQTYIITKIDVVNASEIIKCACIYVNMLVDYIFRQNLLQEDIDKSFVGRVKSVLIDLLFMIKSGDMVDKKKIRKCLLFVEELLVEKECYYSCSAIISCFITKDTFFDLDCTYIASKIIMCEYCQAFNKECALIDYNESAKTLSFMARLNSNYVLDYLCKCIKSISTKNLFKIKEEMEKLTLLYYDFDNCLGQSLELNYNMERENMILSINLSGVSPLGINGMTVFNK